MNRYLLNLLKRRAELLDLIQKQNELFIPAHDLVAEYNVCMRKLSVEYIKRDTLHLGWYPSSRLVREMIRINAQIVKTKEAIAKDPALPDI